MGHDQNKRDAEAGREKMIAKTVEYRAKFGSDPRFLLDALDLLIQCRHMLKYTYVYAFFIDQGKIKMTVKELFEYQQANAEGITERLADAMFAPIDELKADELKNITRVTQRYMDNLTKSFEEMENAEAGLPGAPPAATKPSAPKAVSPLKGTAPARMGGVSIARKPMVKRAAKK